MNSLNWNDVRYFLALVEAGSLSAAARALNVEHSTIARRVDALESDLKLRLFDRLPRGWMLTAEGSNLLPHARSMGDQLLAFERAASGATALAGTVRISAPPALTAYLLAPHLRQALASMPDIELELAGEAGEASLTRREADIALRLNRPRAAGLVAKSLASLQYGLYASKGYLDGRPAQNWEFLGYDDSLRETSQQQWLETLAAERRFILRANDLATIFQAAIAGWGVAALPHFLGRQGKGLVHVEVAAPPVERRLWLVMHEDMRRSPRVRAVADQIILLFGTDEVRSLLGPPEADASR
ncbi:MAG: LysR family transcriptional regulator [Pseudomonadota bacterium]